jgi:hypothetical protein
MKSHFIIIIFICGLLGIPLAICSTPGNAQGSQANPQDTLAVAADSQPYDSAIAHVDSVMGEKYAVNGKDTIYYEVAPEKRSGRLNEYDYKEVARELGVEIAAIKAVTEIETGKQHRGFWSEGKPIINFDLTVYRQMAARNGINLSKYTKSHSVVFARPNAAKYGSQQAAQQARLDAAMTIDRRTAIMGTFWGMFQIGGFNWKMCGVDNIDEFVMLMSRSERDQLELFAAFLRSTGLDKHLRDKNWSAFARGYNGASYASRGYHTRMAAAYSKYKNNN